MKYKRRILICLFAIYCVFLLWLTVFSREPRIDGRIFKGELFWSFRLWLDGKPNGKAESIQNLQNIFLFIPYGLLFPKKKWIVLLISAFIFSTAIEVIQYVWAIGWCEIDDVISNTLGAIIGMVIYLGAIRIKGKIDANLEKTWVL